MLDEYRRTFGPVYDGVVDRVQQIIGVPVSGRPAKSTTSIIEKLNRESIRLSQVQDIAGCRAIVKDVLEQDRAVEAITGAFGAVSVLDRRSKPSHGYRAVHVVVREGGSAIEIQVRTVLQHLWAEISEKYADTVDPSVKYGGGTPSVRKTLNTTTDLIRAVEYLERKFAQRSDVSPDDVAGLVEMRNDLVVILTSMIEDLDTEPEHLE